ncbi:hypothetical protein OROMI_029380 [Orobanche minor]
MSINEEDYIDMVLTTSSPSKNTVEFEFQMSFSRKDQTTQDDDNDNTTSPADELFYKGKLLPLHLPPRQQMVENLASGVPETPSEEEDHNYYYHSMPLISSRTISPPPSKSCRTTMRGGSGNDRDSEEYDRFFDFPGDRTVKKPWSEKLKLVKHPSVIGQKLRASSAYLKSLFTKSVCLEESNRNPGDDQNLCKGEALLNKYQKNTKKQPLGYISRTSHPKIATLIIEDNNNNVSRRSFSGAIKRHSPTKCLSSSSSPNASSSSSSSSSKSNGQCAELNIFRRSSSVNEIEASIDAAIEHCKKSMQIFSCNINLGEDGKKAKSLKY